MSCPPHLVILGTRLRMTAVATGDAPALTMPLVHSERIRGQAFRPALQQFRSESAGARHCVILSNRRSRTNCKA